MASEVAAKHPKPDTVCGECKCQGNLHDDRFDKLQDIIDKYKDQAGSLIPVLHEACLLYTSNPVLSSIKYFRDEYEAHIDEKRCPGGVCRELVRYEIIPEKCKGCSPVSYTHLF